MAGRMSRIEWTKDRVVAAVVVVMATALVLWDIRIDLILRNTTPALSDLGAHLHEPAWLRHELLPRWRLSGWSPDWFAGYPSYTFYFPLGGIVATVLGFVLPYNIAFKLVAASGAILLPLCGYAFGRLNDRDRLTSACLAIGTIPLLLQPKLLTAGGAISSTAYGEWSYQISLAVGLLALGVVGRGLKTGRHRAAAALLLAATVLLHIVPGMMTIIGTLCLVLAHGVVWACLRWVAPVLLTAAAVTGFWTVPFLIRLPYTAGAPFAKATPLSDWLLPTTMAPVLLLGLLGMVAAINAYTRRADTFGLFVLGMAVLSAVIFSFMPASRVWNARFLAFWYLYLGLLAGLGVIALGRWLDGLRRMLAEGRHIDNPTRWQLIVPVVALLLVVPAWDTPITNGALTRRSLDIPTAINLLYGGYQRDPDRKSFEDFMGLMKRVGREHGCGRAHWEWDKSPWTNKRSTLMQLIPYWTDGCVAGMQGLFIESAATSPYVRMTNIHLTENPTRIVAMKEPDVFDMDVGVRDLQTLGVRYFVSTTPQTQGLADLHPGLKLVGETQPDADNRAWKVYEVADVAVVEPLRSAPVVVGGLKSKAEWERVSFPWFRSQERDVVVAAAGPKAWPRRTEATMPLPSEPVPEATVTNVRQGKDSVRFHVDQVGVPILVRVSYFPNWKARGARGPYRVTPNFMVVVPTARDVTLRYGRTAVDVLGWLATLAGLAAAVLLWRSKPVDMPEPRVIEEPPVRPARPKPQSGRQPAKGKARNKRR